MHIKEIVQCAADHQLFWRWSARDKCCVGTLSCHLQSLLYEAAAASSTAHPQMHHHQSLSGTNLFSHITVDAVSLLCNQTNTADHQLCWKELCIKPCLDLTQIRYISFCSCCSHLLVLYVVEVCFRCVTSAQLCMVWIHVKWTDLVSPLPWLRSPRLFSSNIITAQSRPVPVTSMYCMVTMAQELFIQPWMWIMQIPHHLQVYACTSCVVVVCILDTEMRCRLLSTDLSAVINIHSCPRFLWQLRLQDSRSSFKDVQHSWHWDELQIPTSRPFCPDEHLQLLHSCDSFIFTHWSNKSVSSMQSNYSLHLLKQKWIVTSI